MKNNHINLRGKHIISNRLDELVLNSKKTSGKYVRKSAILEKWLIMKPKERNKLQTGTF